jgi:hypothetical protein
MLSRALLLFLLLNLTACSYIDTQWDHAWHPPTIPDASPAAAAPEPQQTSELEARATAEREDPQSPPPPRAPTGYPNLALVPPRPKLPTPAEVAAARSNLEAEQASGAAVIAGEDFTPQAKPRPIVAATTPPAAPASPSLPPIPSNFEGPLYGQAASTSELSIFSAGNRVNMPQSQTIDAPDLSPPPADGTLQ